MNIQSAKYIYKPLNENENAEQVKGGILATIDGIEFNIPLDSGNRHYQAIQEWIADGGTVIDNGE